MSAKIIPQTVHLRPAGMETLPNEKCPFIASSGGTFLRLRFRIAPRILRLRLKEEIQIPLHVGDGLTTYKPGGQRTSETLNAPVRSGCSSYIAKFVS